MENHSLNPLTLFLKRKWLAVQPIPTMHELNTTLQIVWKTPDLCQYVEYFVRDTYFTDQMYALALRLLTCIQEIDALQPMRANTIQIKLIALEEDIRKIGNELYAMFSQTEALDKMRAFYEIVRCFMVEPYSSMYESFFFVDACWIGIGSWNAPF